VDIVLWQGGKPRLLGRRERTGPRRSP